MLALFPEERPLYCPGSEPGAAVAESRLLYGGVYAQATTVIQRGGKVSRGVARVRRDRLADGLTTARLLQRIIRQSFYRSASAFLDDAPVWGSLTGIRPAHVAAALIESGASERAAAKTLEREYYVSPERARLSVEAARVSVLLKQSLEPIDVALYVGIPFCPTRCAYCSFVSNSVDKSFDLIEPFMNTLALETEAVSRMAGELGLRIVALYIGGGTPTSLPEGTLETLMKSLGASFDLSHLREYTVEAGRPDTITAPKMELISRSGAGRVCVNPQSMSPDILSAIGRKHTPDDVLAAVQLVRQCGVALNMDIIAGLPGDTAEGFRGTLDAILSLAPENLTLHTLSLKKGSRIALEGTEIPGGKDVADMLDYASRRLRGSGYRPYYLYRQKFTSGGFENVGWSKPGHEGLYNVCMMEELCTVLALGGGGVTKLISGGGRIERVFNAKYPREYILKAGEIEDKTKRIKGFLREYSFI